MPLVSTIQSWITHFFNRWNISVTNRDFLELHSIYGSVFQRALDILDSTVIGLYRTPNFVGIVEILGSNTNRYLLYEGINYCPCPSFRFDVEKHHTLYSCKHILASRLAVLLNQNDIREISQIEYMSLLNEIRSKHRESKNL